MLSKEGDNLINAYLIEMEKRRVKGNLGTFSERQLLVTLIDLWTAGMETTINAITWGLSFLLLNPEEMKKCQREIDAVTGGERPVSLMDRQDMPYLTATVHVIIFKN